MPKTGRVRAQLSKPRDVVAGRELIFIPAYNEAESVGDVVRSVRAELPDADVLVIDDGSSDETAAVAAAAGARVASLPFNQGLGAALQTGYLYARKNGYRICAHLDSDGQHRPADLKLLLEAVREGRCDMAIGSRYRDGQTSEAAYEPALLRRVGTIFFRRALSALTRHEFTDTTSGLRAAGPSVIELFADYYASDYPELESLQRLVRERLRVLEVPVTMLPRAAGESKFNPFNAAFFVFNGVLMLAVGSLHRGARLSRGERVRR